MVMHINKLYTHTAVVTHIYIYGYTAVNRARMYMSPPKIYSILVPGLQTNTNSSTVPVHIEVSNIILSRSERRVQPLFAPSCTECKTFGAHLSLKTRLNRFFCRLRLPDRINLSSHPCKSRAEVSSYA